MNEDGFVLPFTAILLMVLFLVGGIILDAGSLYLRHGQLHYLAKQSATAGMLTFVEVLENRSEENKNLLCNIEDPPPICNSNDIFDFLTPGEVVDLVSSPVTQERVTEASTTFALTYDGEGSLPVENIESTFPYEYEGVSEIQIQVVLNDVPERFLGGLFPTGETEILVQAVSYIQTPF